MTKNSHSQTHFRQNYIEVNYNNGCIDTVCTVNYFNGEAGKKKVC